MNKVEIKIKESDLENESIKIGYMKMWDVLFSSLSEAEQDCFRTDYEIYKIDIIDKQLVPLDAYVWGLLNFDIKVCYSQKL